MKQLYIHSTIESTGDAVSVGTYWACNGRNPIETPWEFIGDESGLLSALATLRNDSDAEFMHVVNRTMHR